MTEGSVDRLRSDAAALPLCPPEAPPSSRRGFHFLLAYDALVLHGTVADAVAFKHSSLDKDRRQLRQMVSPDVFSGAIETISDREVGEEFHLGDFLDVVPAGVEGDHFELLRRNSGKRIDRHSYESTPETF